jgi:addiction module RelE/StbE family toxin
VKLIWTRAANMDRRTIRSYISRSNSLAAADFDELLSLKASRLVTQAKLGRIGRVAGTRELVVHRNYILIYAVVKDTVRVLRVMHAGRKWPPS